MTVLGKGHQNVGHDEQQNCMQVTPSEKSLWLIPLNSKVLASYSLLFHRDG